jgi:D-glycero-alpha-D-manno-heptose 1-phosphate guanylyltransferase
MIEAIVLAGGQGTRLRAVVRDLPKPMAAIDGRPFLWWLMTRLHQQHVGRVILSVGYKSAAIRDYFGDSMDGMEISYCVESEPLGTGGAMKFALEEASEANVIVLNGDTFADVNLLDLMGEFDSAGVDLAVAVTYLNSIARYGAIVIEEKNNTIRGFDEKQGLPAGYINAGVYCLRRDIFVKCSAPAKFSFERDFLPKELGRMRAIAFRRVRAFIDIGVPEDYMLAQTLIPTLAARIADGMPSQTNAFVRESQSVYHISE